MPGRRSLALLLGLVACADRTVGGDTDATSTDAMSSSTSASTGEPPTTGELATTSSTEGENEPCLEIEYQGSDPPTSWMFTCELPELCPGDKILMFSLGVGTEELLAPDSVEVDDLDRARCMAAALRDRTPGQVSWSVWIDVSALYWPISLEIVGDKAVARSLFVPVTLQLPGPDNISESLHQLRPREFFEACAFGDAMQVWLCLMDAVEPGCLPGPLSCPE